MTHIRKIDSHAVLKAMIDNDPNGVVRAIKTEAGTFGVPHHLGFHNDVIKFCRDMGIDVPDNVERLYLMEDEK